MELSALAHSAIDVSDGLLGDLAHICERSGVGAEVEYDAVPCSADLRPLRDRARGMRAILAGGDDYELCFTAAPERAAGIKALSATLDVALARIGRIVEGHAIAVLDAGGRPLPVKDKGFDHFR
jgi:thiamine-monophosphate kinase